MDIITAERGKFDISLSWCERTLTNVTEASSGVDALTSQRLVVSCHTGDLLRTAVVQSAVVRVRERTTRYHRYNVSETRSSSIADKPRQAFAQITFFYLKNRTERTVELSTYY